MRTGNVTNVHFTFPWFLTLSMNLKEDPVDLLAHIREDALIKGTEAIKHPGLFIVS